MNRVSKGVKLLLVVGIATVVLLAGCSFKKEVKETTLMIPVLDEQTALQLRDEAIVKYFNVFVEGGEQCDSPMDERLADEGEYLYYYCDDLNDKEKIKKYLQVNFAEMIVNDLLNSDSIQIINNKLAYLPIDTGSMLEWENAKIIRVIDIDNPNKKEVEFEVPDVDGEKETIKIEFLYGENRWKINTYPIQFL